MSRDAYVGPYTVITRQKNACTSWGSLPENENLSLKRARHVFADYLRSPEICCKIVLERAPKIICARYAREDACKCKCYNCINGAHRWCDHTPKCRCKQAKQFGMQIVIRR